jgi:hypothetical protein
MIIFNLRETSRKDQIKPGLQERELTLLREGTIFNQRETSRRDQIKPGLQERGLIL